MAERDVVVCDSQGDQLRLRLLGSACEGCAGGCAGRCSLFAASPDGELVMTAPPGLEIAVGQRLRLCLDDATLRRAAWRGYGLAWLGLLLGAGAGFAIGQAWGRHVDVLTLVGLASGTFAAVVGSQQRLPEPHLTPGCRHLPLDSSTSDSP